MADVRVTRGLAVGDGGAFWLDGGAIHGVSDTSDLPQFLREVASDGPASTGGRLGIGGPDLFVSGVAGIFRVAVDGSTEPQRLADPLARAHALVVAGPWLLVARPNWVSDGGGLFRIPIGGGGEEELVPTGWIYDLAADGDDVYWSDAGTSSGPAGSQVPDNNGRIGRHGPSGIEVLLGGMAERPMGIAVDAEHVYWMEYRSGELARMPKVGGARERLASLPGARHIAVAPEGIYLAGGEGISFLPAGSDTVECHAKRPVGTRGGTGLIGISESYVYVQTSVGGAEDGAVMRAPRRAPGG